MATLTNLDHLKRDLNNLVIRILTQTGSAEKSDYYKEKLVLASMLEDIIKKHFNNTSKDQMTNEEAAYIAVNGWRSKE